jgi:NTE family protein
MPTRRTNRTPSTPTWGRTGVAARAAPGPALDLALQGGGSHGAFTWGVLDRLLEEEHRPLEAVSGTSAGALNAAVLACGLARGVAEGAADGGRATARAALAAFWNEVGGQPACFGQTLADEAAASPGPFAPAAALPGWTPGADLGLFNLSLNPFYVWTQHWLRLFSPQQLNPLGLDPLRRIVERHVRREWLCASPLQVFVTATQVRTGQPRVFDNRPPPHGRGDLDVDALLASACLPHLFHPVMIGGEAYWDGGYSGNPALWPLIYRTAAMDLLLVRINALQRPDVPQTGPAIADRASEITFNAGLLSELRAIAFVQKLHAEGKLDPGAYKNLRLHMIADDEGLAPLGPSSKLNTSIAFLRRLHALGVAAAERWLREDRPHVGHRSTLDIRRTFLGQPH